jgi:hypothetical protein
MKRSEVIEKLKKYNGYRRGYIFLEPDTPDGINKTIDTAIEMLQQDEIDFPEPYTTEMHRFLLTNAIRLLNDNQKSRLIIDLYYRLESTLMVNEHISKIMKGGESC